MADNWTGTVSDGLIDDPRLEMVGHLLSTSQDYPQNMTEEGLLYWRAGYQNAMSDLIAELWPGSGGGKRLTADDIRAEDARRAGRTTP